MNGLFESVRRLLAGLVAIAQTRLELVTTELAAEIQRAVGLLLWAAVALFFAGLSVLMIAITLVVFAPESQRPLVAGIVCGCFVAGAVGAGLVVRRRLAARQPLLAASLGELRKDREALERGLAGAARDAGDATSTGRSDAAGGAR
ncbi:MAG: phage holin family protein [Steroidobacteraceae bacterium]